MARAKFGTGGVIPFKDKPFARVDTKVSHWRRTTRNVETYSDPTAETGVPASEGDIPIPLLIGRRLVTSFNTIWTGVPYTTKETVRSEPQHVMQRGTHYMGLTIFGLVEYNWLRGEELSQYYEENPDLVSETTTVKTQVDIAIGLCLGPGVELIKIEDETGNIVWDDEPEPGERNFAVPNFCERLYFYPGSFNQSVNPVMLAKDGAALTPAYNGLSYIVAKGVFIGDDFSPVSAMGFELVRPVNKLALPDNVKENAARDQNIANAIVEILTDRWNGVKMPVAFLDLPSFVACGTTLANEGNWCSVLVSTQTAAKNIIAGLLQQADGCMRWNPVAGKYSMKLYREDFNVLLLPDFSEDNVTTVTDFVKEQWRNLPQAVTLAYIDRDQRYIETSVGIKVNQHVSEYALRQESVKLTTIVTNEVAEIVLPQIAARTLTPLLSGAIETGRDAEPLLPGDVLKLTWPNLPGVNQLPMRITDKQEAGALKDTFVLRVEQAQLPAKNMRRPAPPSWAPSTNFSVSAPEEAEVTIYAAPLFFLKNKGGTYRNGATEQSPALHLPLFLVESDNAPAFRFNGIDEQNDFKEYNFADMASPVIVGTLSAALSKNDGYSNRRWTIGVTCPGWKDTPNMYNPGRQFGGFVLIGNEILQYELGLGEAPTITLNNCHRGLLDTIPQDHAAGAKVYILPDLSMVGRYALPSGDYSVYAYGVTGFRISNTATWLDKTGQDVVRAVRPACPQNGQITATGVPLANRAENPVVTIGGNYTVTWEERNRLSRSAAWFGEGSQAMTEATTYDVTLKSAGNTDVLASGVSGDSVAVAIPAGLTAGAATIEIVANSAHGTSLYAETINLTLA